MSSRFQRITPFLWFDHQAEEAVDFYVSVFENSRITATTRFNAESAAASGCPEGSVMTIGFDLDGQSFAALNGGPVFRFNEAVSLVVNCHSQDEVDYYWDRLTQGGDAKAQQCGWLKDRYGLSWQVVPTELIDMLTHPDPLKVGKATGALMQMKKIDLDALRRAMA
ncbi:VOC family protein [Dyella soli]|uniref:VOC family protein n=1 Tax=Dyella soli TaxID=522319 RepID=A0A4R0YLZ2_9GAMM|nr:VOC family protein [Dyella soli]TCI06729.1 VOC family protein [Dyella soli]